MRQKIAFLTGFFLLLILIGACNNRDRTGSADEGDGNNRTPPVLPDNTIDIYREFNAEVTFSQGGVYITRDGKDIPLNRETRLGPGDRIRTGADGSAELVFGSLGVIRLLPESELELTQLYVMESQKKYDVMILLIRGVVFASVEKINPEDEFLIGTPNSLARVRGTRYMVSYDPPVNPEPRRDNGRSARTTLAVKNGEVSLLPRGELISGFAENRLDDGFANEMLMSAFDLAPRADAGQELVLGGAVGDDARLAEKKDLIRIEAAYADITLEGAASGESREVLKDVLSRFNPETYRPDTSFLMKYMDYLRDPGTAAETIPAALPQEFFPAYQDNRAYPKTGTTPAKPVNPFPAVIWEARISSVPLADAISRTGDTLLVIDKDGKVTGINDEGSVVWTFNDRANGMIGLDQGVALVTNEKMVLLDGSNGTARGEFAFTWGAVPNAKPVPVPDGVALATPRGVTICRQSNAQVLREIPVSGGIISTLVLADKELTGINGAGNLIIMNISAGSIRLEVPLGLGPDILTPRYLEGRIYMANKSGRIVAVEVESGKKLWDRDLAAGLSIEPELDSERLYVWTAARTLIRMSTADGNPVGSPIQNVESAPLLSNGRLYWGGKGGTLVVADPASGRILKSNPIPDSVTVRPLMVGDNLFVGTQGGRLIKVRSEFL